MTHPQVRLLCVCDRVSQRSRMPADGRRRAWLSQHTSKREKACHARTWQAWQGLSWPAKKKGRLAAPLVSSPATEALRLLVAVPRDHARDVDT